MFIPMIDMKPTDMTCYLTLTFPIRTCQALRSNTSAYLWPAFVVEGNDNCRWCSRGQPSTFSHFTTRGFHILMIFLGSIGHLTAGTGLRVFNMYWKSHSLETQLSAYSVEKLSQAPSMVTSFLIPSFIYFCMQTRGAHMWEHPFRTRLSGVQYYIQTKWDRESSWNKTCQRE